MRGINNINETGINCHSTYTSMTLLYKFYEQLIYMGGGSKDSPDFL